MPETSVPAAAEGMPIFPDFNTHLGGGGNCIAAPLDQLLHDYRRMREIELDSAESSFNVCNPSSAHDFKQIAAAASIAVVAIEKRIRAYQPKSLSEAARLAQWTIEEGEVAFNPEDLFRVLASIAASVRPA